MAEVYRANRKATDQDIIRLNSLGLSLRAIGEELGCHPSTVKIRLDNLGVPPADTRRSFTQDIYERLTPEQRKWLADKLGPHISIKDYITNLIQSSYVNQEGNTDAA
jgi:IS30 family transposase